MLAVFYFLTAGSDPTPETTWSTFYREMLSTGEVLCLRNIRIPLESRTRAVLNCKFFCQTFENLLPPLPHSCLKSVAVADPGEGPCPPPLFLDQTEAWRARKNFLETPPPPHLRVWMTHPPPYLKVWIGHSIVQWWWQFPTKMTLVHSPIPHLRRISMLNAFLTYYELGHNIYGEVIDLSTVWTLLTLSIIVMTMDYVLMKMLTYKERVHSSPKRMSVSSLTLLPGWAFGGTIKPGQNLCVFA